MRKSIVESYLANPRLWKPKQFRNRNAVEIEEGDMVQIIYSREVGIVTKVRPQTVIVRKRGVEGVPVHKQNLRLIVSRRLGLENKAPKMESHDKTVFLSIPMQSEAKEITIVRKVKEDEAIKDGCNSINLAKEIGRAHV